MGTGQTHHVAVQRLHFDDLCAVGTQDTGCGGGGHHSAHLYDFYALQGQLLLRHSLAPLVSSGPTERPIDTLLIKY